MEDDHPNPAKPRGRPALHPAGTSAAQRATMSRAAIIQAGGSRLEVLLDKDATEALQLITTTTGETRTEVLSRLALAEAAKIKRRKS